MNQLFIQRFLMPFTYSVAGVFIAKGDLANFWIGVCLLIIGSVLNDFKL
jgi:uncharacterized membrane protein YqaE (UPF0057 family)